MVWKGCIMKLEIEITTYHYDLLKKISEYTEIDLNKLTKGIIINSIEQFDSDMREFMEQNLPYSYYDDFSGRYIE